jgi:hypothetical protein
MKLITMHGVNEWIATPTHNNQHHKQQQQQWALCLFLCSSTLQYGLVSPKERLEEGKYGNDSGSGSTVYSTCPLAAANSNTVRVPLSTHILVHTLHNNQLKEPKQLLVQQSLHRYCSSRRLPQHNTTPCQCQKNWQHSTTQHNTTQHNTTQHNTTKHNTTQHNTVLLISPTPPPTGQGGITRTVLHCRSLCKPPVGIV